MSKIALTGNASGTGTLTIAAPNTNTDRTLTLPDSAGTVDTLQRAGNVLQSIRTYIANTEVLVASATFTEASSACRVSITPKQLNSLIYIDMNCGMVYHDLSSSIRGTMYVKVGAGSFAAMPAYNGTTPGAYHIGYQDGLAAYAPWSFGGIYIHSSISDELTFSPFVRTDGNTGRFIHSNSSYSITVTEVAQ